MRVLRALFLSCALVISGSVTAQQAAPVLNAPVLVIDADRVFSESETGRAIVAELDAAAAAVQIENDQIVADLIAEEKSLTERRPSMDPDVFRAEAEAFDQKAQDIRRARDSKDRELTQAANTARTQFFEALRPIVGQIMVDRGGIAVLDSRSVYLALRAADITNAAISAVDAQTNQ